MCIILKALLSEFLQVKKTFGVDCMWSRGSGTFRDPRVVVEGTDSLQGEKKGEGGQASQSLGGGIRDVSNRKLGGGTLSTEERRPSSVLSSKASNRLTDPVLFSCGNQGRHKA